MLAPSVTFRSVEGKIAKAIIPENWLALPACGPRATVDQTTRDTPYPLVVALIYNYTPEYAELPIKHSNETDQAQTAK
jgi:hypothetical protein